MVERSICIREAPGSIPGFSSFDHFAEIVGRHCIEARRLFFVLRSLTKVSGSILGTLKICRDPGLNQGPSDLQSDALPTELSRLCILSSRFLCHGIDYEKQFKIVSKQLYLASGTVLCTI